MAKESVVSTLTVLVGESGAGKSTAMRLLLGAYQPDEGSAYVRAEGRRISAHFLCSRISFHFKEVAKQSAHVATTATQRAEDGAGV